MSETQKHCAFVGRVPSRGVPVPPRGVPVPSRGLPVPVPGESPPRRLRRLHRVWPDREGNISYLLTICVDGRANVLNNEATFDRLIAFLLDSTRRYCWFGSRFIVMPDHIHLIAHMGHEAVRLGQWIKALKAVVGGLESRAVGRVPSRGVPVPSRGAPETPREFTRTKRAWRWQDGFHDHKFRTSESESRKWEYVCLNPVRGGFVKRPEEWPFGGELFYDAVGGPKLVRGTPPLLETGMLLEEETPREGTRPTI